MCCGQYVVGCQLHEALTVLLWVMPLLPCFQAMMRPCYSAILNHAAGGKPAIVFVPTRKHVRLTALDLLTSAAADGQQHR
jgi:hypothetical protein